MAEKSGGYRRIAVFAVLFLTAPGTAQALFHLWSIQEIYSSADGSVQFLELRTDFNSQQFLAGHTITVTETGPPNQVNLFTFGADAPAPTAGHSLLLATPGFAGLPGGVSPDYVIPTGLLFTAGATINFAENSDIVVYTALPVDGTSSVNRVNTPGLNSPMNYNGNSGSVNVPPPPPAPTVSTNRTLSEAGLVGGEILIRWESAATEKYDVVYSGDLSDTSSYKFAQANVQPSPDGTNIFDRPPLLGSPLFGENKTLFYGLRVLPNVTTSLPVRLDTVVSNRASPVVLTHAGDGSGRLFICEQFGQILVYKNGSLLPTPFLDLSSTITNLAPNGIGGIMTPGLNSIFDERGLLGLAFHPGYSTNGRFFVYYSAPRAGPDINHESIVAEYGVSAGDPDVADTNEVVVLRFDEPQFNHNAGTLAFGPDGYLYIALGDGGGGGDGTDASPGHGVWGNGQNVSNLLGSILRIDVDSGTPYGIPPDNPFAGGEGRDEIYAYGMRNPFKMSFDRGGSNALFVADVGQGAWEEINVVEKGGNYGWRILEGLHAFDAPSAEPQGVNIRDLKEPIHEYHHDIGGISVIGGYVYRGTNYPALTERYVFGDFSSGFGSPDGKLFYLEESRPGIWERFEFVLAPSNVPLGEYVKGFGEDEDGELYLLSSTTLGPYGTGATVRILRAP